MDLDRFDGLARQLHGAGSARREAIRILGGMFLGGAFGRVAARLGRTEAVEAKSKHHQEGRRRRNRRHSREEGTQAEGKGGKKKRKKKKQCGDPVPTCPPCQEPRCNTATGKYTCRNACRAGFSCCNGLCEPPCNNGCTMNANNACICETPRAAGDVYCAAEHLCAANPCESGQEYDSTTCECHEEDPTLCAPGWEWCNGACRDATYGPWTTCGNTCCRSDEECCNGKCVAKQFGPYTPCGATCCADKQSQCCNGRCWPKELGTWFECGGVCCRNEYDQCCGGVCCYKESVCCGDYCRPAGYSC